MSSPVKRPRPYDSSRRRAQARQTRVAILEAARVQFLERGYATTTIGDIASAVGVSVETVYKAFANKAGLLKAIFDLAIVGDDAPIPFQQREIVARIRAEPDGRRKFEIYGADYAERAKRAVPVQLLARDAAASDPSARAVLEELNTERLTGMTAFSQHLHESKVLRKGVRAAEAVDVLWLFTAPETYERLVIERGWTTKRFGKWIARQLTAALL